MVYGAANEFSFRAIPVGEPQGLGPFHGTPRHNTISDYKACVKVTVVYWLRPMRMSKRWSRANAGHKMIKGAQRREERE